MNLYNSLPDIHKLLARMKRDKIDGEVLPIIVGVRSVSTGSVYKIICSGVFNDLSMLIHAYQTRRDGCITSMLIYDGDSYRMATSADVANAREFS